mmetsp:Transcript_122797/g.352697  ORF Transcript_122797/g.352697 Transcript_122797/m.352697 type:complete len:222 (-) Transcript_122797:152-817(-)
MARESEGDPEPEEEGEGAHAGAEGAGAEGAGGEGAHGGAEGAGGAGGRASGADVAREPRGHPRRRLQDAERDTHQRLFSAALLGAEFRRGRPVCNLPPERHQHVQPHRRRHASAVATEHDRERPVPRRPPGDQRALEFHALPPDADGGRFGRLPEPRRPASRGLPRDGPRLPARLPAGGVPGHPGRDVHVPKQVGPAALRDLRRVESHRHVVVGRHRPLRP